MKRVFICSPYSGDIARNTEIAREFMGHALRAGYAPFAPHLMYPQVLDDARADQREMGIACGMAWLDVCDEVWVLGADITPGMKAEIERAREIGKPIREYCRSIEFWGIGGKGEGGR